MKPSNNMIFVGREKELMILREQWEVVLSEKTPKFILIQGDYGIGKTSLTEKFLDLCAATENVTIARGRCEIGYQKNTLIPFGQVLADLAEKNINWKTLGSNFWTFIKKVAPGWVDIFTAGIASKSIDAVTKTVDEFGVFTHKGKTQFSSENIYNQFTNVLSELSKNKIIIIFIEDLHWADESSLYLIDHLSRFFHNRPILFIGTYRPVEAMESGQNAEVFCQIRANLFTSGNVKELTLQHGIDVKEYLKQKYKKYLIPEKIINDIQKSSDGHPLYIDQLFSLWQQTGALAQSKDQETWRMTREINLTEAPLSVGKILDERIRILSDELKKMLKIASVEGNDFTTQTITSILKMKEQNIFQDIELLIKNYLLIQETGAKDVGVAILDFFRFTHPFFRERIYQNHLIDSERRFLHRQVGEFLEKLFESDLAPIAAQLASHFSIAMVRDKAIKYALLASEFEQDHFGWLESEKWCYFGLNLLDKLPVSIETKSTRYKFKYQLGVIYYSIGKWSSAYDEFLYVLSLSQDLDLPSKEKIGLLLKLVDISDGKNDLPTAQKYLQEAQESIESLENSNTEYNAERFSSGTLKGRILVRKGFNKQAIKILSATLKMKSSVLLPKEAALGYNYLALAFSNLDFCEEAISSFEKTIQISREIGDKKTELLGILNLADEYVFQLNFADADKLNAYALSLSREIGDLDSQAYALSTLGHLHLESGRFDEAISTLYNALKIFNELKAEWNLSFVYSDLALTYLQKKDVSLASECSEKAMSYAVKDDYPFNIGYTFDVAARVESAKQNWGQANIYFKRSISAYTKEGDKHLTALTKCHFAEALIEQNMRVQATNNLTSAIKFFQIKKISNSKELIYAKKVLAQIHNTQ